MGNQISAQCTNLIPQDEYLSQTGPWTPVEMHVTTDENSDIFKQ